jgi:hypothetical protein
MVEINQTAHEVYEESLSTIKQITGLKDLSLIEKVALKQIAVDAAKRVMEVIGAYSEFPPVSETVAMFLDGYYDILCVTQMDRSWLNQIRRKSRYDHERLTNFFRKRQDERHLL